MTGFSFSFYKIYKVPTSFFKVCCVHLCHGFIIEQVIMNLYIYIYIIIYEKYIPLENLICVDSYMVFFE